MEPQLFIFKTRQFNWTRLKWRELPWLQLSNQCNLNISVRSNYTNERSNCATSHNSIYTASHTKIPAISWQSRLCFLNNSLLIFTCFSGSVLWFRSLPNNSSKHRASLLHNNSSCFYARLDNAYRSLKFTLRDPFNSAVCRWSNILSMAYITSFSSLCNVCYLGKVVGPHCCGDSKRGFCSRNQPWCAAVCF